MNFRGFVSLRREIIQGDVLEVLSGMPDASIDCIMTSPPYWALRAYLPKHHADKSKELGSEATWREHLERLKPVFAEVKRVLKPWGNLWVNYGDTTSSGNRPGAVSGTPGKRAVDHGQPQSASNRNGRMENGPPKHKIGLAWRLRFTLNDELGFISRSDVVWHKMNAMPLSMKDRVTPKYEMVFQFVKQGRYFFDLDAIRKPFAEGSVERMAAGGTVTDDGSSAGVPRAWKDGEFVPNNNPGRFRRRDDNTWDARRGRSVNGKGPPPGQKPQSSQRPLMGAAQGEIVANGGVPGGNKQDMPSGRLDGIRQGFNARWDDSVANNELLGGSNPGDVWSIPSQPTKEAHFATFPEALVERVLLSSCPERVCVECDTPWRKKYDAQVDWTRGNPRDRGAENRFQVAHAEGVRYPGGGMIGTGSASHRFVGWEHCDCEAPYRPGVVLDPFGGSGTVGVVAGRLGMGFVLTELNGEYVKMARRRLGELLNPLETFQ